MDYLGKKYSPPKSLDGIWRIIGTSDASSSFDVHYLAETGSFAYKLYNIIQEDSILKKVVRNLWKTHLYNQEYVSYLLGACSKEEFKEIAKQFAEFAEYCDDNEYIYIATNVCLNVLNQNLTTSDFSLLLNIDHECLAKTMPQIGYSPIEHEDE